MTDTRTPLSLRTSCTRPAAASVRLTNSEDQWCDWCGELITAAPCRIGDRVFCGLACVAAYRKCP